MASTISCPSCGAPLRPAPGQTSAICLYCSSAVQLGDGARAGQPAAAPVGEELLAHVKQLLLEGRRDEALRLYVAERGVTAGEAAEQIADLGRQVALGVIRRQQLTAAGLAYVALYALAAAGSALLAQRGVLHPLLGYGVALFAASLLLTMLPSLRATLRFARAGRAVATIRRMAPIGVFQTRRMPVHAFKVLVDVQPEGGAPFVGELLLPVREQSLARAQPGARLLVRYLPGDPPELLYDRTE